MPIVVRRSIPNNEHIQSILINKKKYSIQQSKELINRKFHAFDDGLDIKGKYDRWRQQNPDSKKFNYYTVVLKYKNGKRVGISLIVGIPKNSHLAYHEYVSSLKKLYGYY